ncbi:MAG: translocation/assembly module TamB domain-containing protein [Deltaproteobacteria bacterium]|nr:translocation/assembly module TamB domain-containing protein [Deltaproteobacteria bacterium]
MARGPGRLTGWSQTVVKQGRPASGRAEVVLDKLSPPPGLIWDLLGIKIALIDLSSVKLTGPFKAIWPGPNLTISCPGFRLDSRWGLIKGLGRLEMTPAGRVKEYSLELDVTQFQVPDWLWPLLSQELKEAVVHGHFTVEGKDKSGRFEADLGGSAFRGEEIKNLKLSGRFSPQAIDLERLDLAFLGAELSLKGRVWPQTALKTSLQGQNLSQIREFLALTGTDLKARHYQFEGTVTGSLSQPRILGHLQAKKAAHNQTRAQEVDLKLNLTLPSPVGRALPQGQVEGRITGLTWAKDQSLDLKGDFVLGQARCQGRIEILSPRGQVKTGLEMTQAGPGSFKLVLAGLELALARGQETETWRAARPAEIKLNSRGLTGLKLALSGPGQQAVSLALTLEQGQISGQGQLQDLNLVPWLAFFDRPEISAGRFSASLKVSGPASRPRASLSGHLEGLVVLDQKLDDLSLRADLAQGRLTGQGKLTALNLPVGDVSGQMGLTFSAAPWGFEPDLKSLKAKLKIDDLPLAVFNPALKDLEGLQGRLRAELDLTPTPRGWLKIDDLAFRVAATGQRIQKGQIHLGLDQERLTIDQLTASLGGGQLSASGWMGLGQDRPLNFEVNLNPTLVSLGALGQSRFSGFVKIGQTLAAPSAVGKIHVENLHFSLPKSAPEESEEIVMVDQDQSQTAPPALPDRLRLDLEINLGQALKIQGEGLKAELSGLLKAVKEASGPVQVTGKMKVKKGTFARFGRRFTLEGGDITFSGRTPPDPTLNIKARNRVKQVDVNLNIAGTAAKPELLLSSQPPMSRQDILAYLLFGQPAADLNQSQSGQVESQALGVLGGPATEIVKGIAGEKLAPDSVSVSASPEGGLSVETGKQILPDLYISYEAFTESSKPNEFHIEYRLSPNISVESSLGDAKTSGVDVFFRYDF